MQLSYNIKCKNSTSNLRQIAQNFSQKIGYNIVIEYNIFFSCVAPKTLDFKYLSCTEN